MVACVVLWTLTIYTCLYFNCHMNSVFTDMTAKLEKSPKLHISPSEAMCQTEVWEPLRTPEMKGF